MLPASTRIPSAATRGDNSTTPPPAAPVVPPLTHRKGSTTLPPKAGHRPLRWISVDTGQKEDDNNDSETDDEDIPARPPPSSSPYSILPRKTPSPLEHAQPDSESLYFGSSRPPSSLSYGGSSDCSRIDVPDEHGYTPWKKTDNVPNINGFNSGGSSDPSITRIISSFGEDNLREALVQEFQEANCRHSAQSIAGNQHFDGKEGGTEYCNNPRESFLENNDSSISAMYHNQNSSMPSDIYEPLTPIDEFWAHSHTENLSLWTDLHTDGLKFSNPRCREDTYGMANSPKPYHGKEKGERETAAKDGNNRAGGYLKYTETYPQDEPAIAQRGGLQETPFYTRRYPPMPREGTVPFVLCRCCLKLLEVPVRLPLIGGSVRKLRCGSCWKVLKFSTTPELGIFNTNRIGKEVPPSISPIFLPFTFRMEKREMRSPPPMTNRREQRNHFCNEASPTSTVDNIWLGKPLNWSCSSSNSSDKPKTLRSPLESLDGGSRNESPHHVGINSTSDSQYSNRNHGKSNYSQSSNQAKQGGNNPNYSQNPYNAPALGSPLNQQATHGSTLLNAKMSAATDAPENPVEDAPGNEGMSFTGLVKKGLKGILKRTQGGGDSAGKVIINGHVVPHFEVLNVEKVAGPIYAGSYWYDIRTGFWGIANSPCRGIIPPSIKEFQRYPMARDCAQGNTGILVNGRELHEKDLTVLLKRGLPTTPGKSYSIYFSGLVVDDATGKEVCNLGTLAPSLQKRGMGYGMHPWPILPNRGCP